MIVLVYVVATLVLFHLVNLLVGSAYLGITFYRQAQRRRTLQRLKKLAGTTKA